MINLPKWITANPALPWGILFLLLSLAVTQYGGTNALSRVAAMRAITEGHTLHIDNYKDWTIDWASSTNGHIYSNKAPGGALLGLPFFALTELVSLPLAKAKNRIDEYGRAPQPAYPAHIFTMLCLQLLPCFLLVLWIVSNLQARGVSKGALHFFALAVFFGNTAALYLNSNFGHGLAALLFLAAFYCWTERRYLATGAFFSWALLTDYGVAFALPPLLIASLWREKNLRTLFQVSLGALPGGIVWIVYHWVAFGSPFAMGITQSNPEQLALPKHTTNALWGTYALLPSPTVVGELLFGSSRGLLFTQPWVLIVFAIPFLKNDRLPHGTALFTLGSFVGMLWMNASFGGWQGGWCLGPRYLAALFPAIALALTLAWNDRAPPLHWFLGLGLAVALAFRILVYPFSTLAPDVNLWAYHFDLIQQNPRGTIMLRYAIALATSVGAIFWFYRRSGISIFKKSV